MKYIWGFLILKAFRDQVKWFCINYWWVILVLLILAVIGWIIEWKEKQNKRVKKMGFGSWFARKGNVGGTARAVAKGWETIKKKNPGMSPEDIAKIYLNTRYMATGELHMAEKVLDRLPYDVNPLNLSWIILWVENEDEYDTLFDHWSEWIQIMREEIRKYGVEPGEFFYHPK